MLIVENTILILLAAGRSDQFGDIGSKLDEDFLGKPLGLHVAVALGDMPFRERIAVTGGCRLDYAAQGFRVLPADDPAGDVAGSVRRGIACAVERRAEAVLFALAHMPRVTAAHVHRMFDVAYDTRCVVASSDGKETKPPALFGSERFDFLARLTGENGARDLVAAGRHVVTSPAELIDVDTPEKLDELRALVRSPAAITRAAARRSG